jgi:hypothetical protein
MSEGGSSRNPSEIIRQIHGGMLELAQVLTKAQNVTTIKDKADFQRLLDGFEEFVEDNMTAEPGEDKQSQAKEKPDAGLRQVVSFESGGAEVEPIS